MVSQREGRPVLEEADEDWSPFLDSEMKQQWLELKNSGKPYGALIELIEDCFGAEPWREVPEDYRALVFFLAFQHQPGAQWASWLQWLGEHLRARRRRICARSRSEAVPGRRG